MELSKTKFSLYRNLGSAKMRKRHSLFMVEGEKAVADMIGRFDLEALIIEAGSQLGAIGMSAMEAVPSDKLFYAKADMMSALSNLSNVPKMIAIFRLPAEVENMNLDAGDSLVVALDGVQDPGNLGTIIRTCHWFGIRRIFASHDTVDLYNPKVLQGAMGSVGHVDVTYCHLPELFASNPGMPVYGTLLDGEDIFRAELGDKGFIVMGNEGNGLSAEVRSLVSKPLLIPPYSSDHGESLNVAIATAIVLAQFRK